MQTTATADLTPGTVILNDLTGEPAATVESVEEVRGRYTVTFTDGRTFPHLTAKFPLRTA